jgi:hypothetical protein
LTHRFMRHVDWYDGFQLLRSTVELRVHVADDQAENQVSRSLKCCKQRKIRHGFARVEQQHLEHCDDAERPLCVGRVSHPPLHAKPRRDTALFRMAGEMGEARFKPTEGWLGTSETVCGPPELDVGG